MEFMSVRDASALWEISERWVQKLCEEGRIAGVERFGHSWMIPKDAQRPPDRRKKKTGTVDSGEAGCAGGGRYETK